MGKLAKVFFSQKGMTLIEILASLVILSIITVSLLSLFAQSSRSNQYSKNMSDSTTIAESQMEEIYNLSTTSSFAETVNKLDDDYGYTKTDQDCQTGHCFYKVINDRFVTVHLKDSGSVVVKVHKDGSKAKKEAQMELLIPWTH